MSFNIRGPDVLDTLPEVAEVGVEKLFLKEAGMARSNHVDASDAVAFGEQFPR